MTRVGWSRGKPAVGRLALFGVASLLLVALLIPLLLAIEEDQTSLVTWLQPLAAELAITVSDPQVWIAIGVALLFGGVSLLFGTWVARTVGLLRANAPAGETLGVGLASGLMVLAAWWAAIWSGGRSSFTPVAVGFAIALGLAGVHRVRRHSVPEAPEGAAKSDGDATIPPRSPRRRSLVFTALAGGVFVVAIALLYGATLAPSPRHGVQPVEFMDEALYAVLGRDLATTGTETTLSPSGFTDLPGLPAQTWYHWGELWLASAVITVFGTAPLAARYFVVLPVLLLAAAALTGTLVRRMSGTASRGAYAFGFVACLFLAPIPFVWVTAFSSWAAGLIFWLTLYGLAAVGVLLALYGLAVLGTGKPTWALGIFAGSAAALILPAQVVIALLALVGVGSAWAINVARSVRATRRLPTASPIWRPTIIATVIALCATVAWGVLTGHGLGGSAVSPFVTPFDAVWGVSVAATYLGAGVLFSIPLAWVLAHRSRPAVADTYLGTIVILVVGAIMWGARLGDFNMFHVFLGGVELIATPVAAVATYSIWARLRRTRRLRLSAGVVALFAIQLGVGAVHCLHELEQFGPSENSQPIAVSVLRAIGQLPPNAKLAYACEPLVEVSFTDPRLLSIDAHTGRRVIPMCFQADYFGALLGTPRSTQTPSPFFLASAPQRLLYPDAAAHPSSPAVVAFLRKHGIDYIYADAAHPNSLVANAALIATSGDAEILRVP